MKEEGEEMKLGIKKDLIELHRAMLSYFERQLASDKPMKASQLNVARQFLKDNGIAMDKLEEEDAGEMQHYPLEQLELPFKNPGDRITG